MKTNYLFKRLGFMLSFLMLLSLAHGQSVTATYTTGDIGSTYLLGGPTSTAASSTCPGTLVVTIPITAVVTGVDVAYSFVAPTAGGGYMSEQRSYLKCTSTGGTAEASIASGTGLGGTMLYSRTGLTIANSVSGGGAITFQMHAWRTWQGTAGCDAVVNGVANNTWIVTVNYTIPVNIDLGILSLDAPVTACGLTATEPVTIQVKNYGLVTQSSYSLKYSINSGPWVTQTMTTPILPDSVLNHTFATTANLSAAGTYSVEAVVVLAGDLITSNDSIQDSITNTLNLVNPVTSNVSSVYATTATLTATHTDSIYWFSDPYGMNQLHAGASFTTPILYDTTTYYVQAKAGVADIKITEIVQYKGGGGATNPYPSWINGSAISDLDGLEITNLGTAVADLSGWTVNFEGYMTGSFTFPSGTTLPAGDILVLDYRSATSGTNTTNNYYCLGQTWSPQSSSTVGYYVKDALGVVVDVVATNGYSFSTGSGVTSADWSGNIAGSGSKAGVTRNTSDNNLASDWGVAGTNPTTQSFGSLNVGLTAGSGGGGPNCPSAIIPVTVYVTGIPLYDAGVVEITEPVGLTASGTLPVKVTIKNFGVMTLTKATINYSVGGVIQTPAYLWTGSLGTNDTSAVITVGTAVFGSGIVDIVAWTTLPNDSVDQANWNDTATAQAVLCFNGNYTIGTTGDFTTIGQAADALALAGICGPVVFNIDTGTFNEQIIIGSVVGASATNTITFKGSGNTNIFYESTSSSKRAIVTLDGAKHIILDSLNIISGPAATLGWGIHLWHAADSNIIRNCRIELNNTGSSSNFNGIVASNSATSYTTYGNNAHYLTIENNTFVGGYRAINLYGQGSGVLTEGIKILNNTLTNYTYAAIYLYYMDAVQVVGNDLTGTGNYGMYLRYCDNASKFSKNNIKHTGSYGMYMYYCDGTATDRLEISNNFVSKTTSYAMYIRYPKYYDVLYNSINVSGGQGFYFYNSSTSYTGHNITNNNFVNTGSSYAAYIYNNTYLTSADYNNYYSPTGSYVYWGGARADLAALQAAYATRNMNSVSMDPAFMSSTDLHTLSIPFNNLGTPVTLVTTDIDGDTRDLLTPDIGADEYTPPANDLAVVEWLTPLTGMNTNATATVSVRLANFGTASQINPTVKYSIDGGATTTTGSYTGTIASQDTVTVTFTTTANFGTFGNYNCLAYPEFSGDQNRSNDTVFYDVYACTPLTGSYTIGLGAGATFASFGDAAQALTACGITGPVVITADTGVFNEQVNITNIPGASATNTVTFMGTSGNTNIFFESTNGSKRAVVTLDGAMHVTLDGLNIVSGAAATYGWGVHLWHSADSNTIQNCYIELNNIGNSGNFNGIVASNSNTSYSSNGANASYLTLDNNTVKGGYYGIIIRGQGSTSLAAGTKIMNNTLYDYTYYGMYLYYHDAPVITGNTLTGIYGAYYNMYFGYCDNDMKVTNNKIDFQYGYGLYAYYCDGTTSSRGLIANNMISQDTRNSTTYGLRINYCKNQDIVYNSVNVNVGNTSGYAFYYYNSSTTYVGCQFSNNNFVNSGAGYAAYIYNNTYLDSANYNNYYRASAGNLLYWGGYRADLAAAQTAYPLNNVNSVSMDPEYLSNTDLHTYSIPFNNLGTPLTYVTDDFDGETRSLTTPNIGADEYTPPANDLGVVEIISAFDSYCGSSDSLFVVVKNFGTATQMSVPVSFMGTSPAGPISMTGTIASIASLQFDTVYMGILTATTAGMYSAVAYATLAADTMPANDTMAANGEVYQTESIGYVQTFDSINGIHWDMVGDGSFSWMHDNSGAVYANFDGQNDGNICEMISPSINIPAGSPAYIGYSFSQNDYYYPGDIDTLKIYIKSCNDANWTLISTSDSADLLTTGGSATTPGNYEDASVMIPASMQGTNVRIMFQGISAYGSNLYIDAVTVFNAPMVSIGPDTALCDGNSYTYDAGTSFGASYLWTRALDTLGTSQTYTATTAGTYVVQVSKFGVMVSDTAVVTINALPMVSFTGLNATYCEDEMVATLMGTPVNGVFSGNGISVNMFYPDSAGVGSHVITYDYTDMNGCFNYATDTTMVYEIPMAVMTLDTTICDGESVMLTAGSPAPAAPSLIFSMYIEGSSNNKAIEVYNATMDTLNLDDYSIATNYNGNAWSGQYRFPAGYMLAPGSVFVIGNSSADSAILAVSDDSLAYNEGGYVVGFNGDDVRGLYKHNSAIDSMMIDIIGRYDMVDPGSGWDVAGVTNATKDHSLVRKSTIVGGNTDWDMIAGTDSLDSEYIVYPQNTFMMLGSHSAAPATVMPNTYLWSNGDTTSTITVMPSMTTNFTVTIDNGNCMIVDSVLVTVTPLPVVNIGPDTAFKWTWESITLDAGNPNASWNWSTGDMTQTVVLDNANLMKGANTVSVMVTENGCSASDTAIVTVIDDVSINGALNNMNIEVYPNPAKGQFNMTINGYLGNIEMEIVDVTGQIVYSEKLNVTANFIGKFNVTSLASGVYHIRLTANSGVKVQRLMIQK